MRFTTILIFSLVLTVSVLFAPQDALAAQGEAASEASLRSSPPLCLPGIYVENPGDCSALGPSAYLSEMAAQGITLPLEPLPAAQTDPSLSYVPYKYVKVEATSAPIYGSLEDALTGDKKRASRILSAPDLTYVSYAEEVYVDNKRFYRLETGEWMTTLGVSRIGAIPNFRGVELRSTPRHPFGWVLTFLSGGAIETKRTPGYEHNDYTGRVLQNFELVSVYAVENVNGTDWYRVGPEDWVVHTVVARVIPNTKPPRDIQADRWIEVNLYEQTIAVYDNRQLVFATLIASGLDPFWTRPGLFQIETKLETTPMRGAFEADRSDAYFLDNVPWTMYFDEARALHGAYWRTQLGYPQSHGCVNLSVGDSRWIFDWAKEGDWVYVWDPSGITPEDPSLYTAGGA